MPETIAEAKARFNNDTTDLAIALQIERERAASFHRRAQAAESALRDWHKIVEGVPMERKVQTEVALARRERDAEWAQAWKNEVELLPWAGEFREHPTCPDGVAQALRGLVIWAQARASIQQLLRYDVKPGDKLVLSCPDRLSCEAVSRLRASLAEEFKDWDVQPRILILQEGMTLAVISQEKERA